MCDCGFGISNCGFGIFDVELWNVIFVDGLLGGNAFPFSENSNNKLENPIKEPESFII
jgi:hypothetical protein